MRYFRQENSCKCIHVFSKLDKRVIDSHYNVTIYRFYGVFLTQSVNSNVKMCSNINNITLKNVTAEYIF